MVKVAGIYKTWHLPSPPASPHPFSFLAPFPPLTSSRSQEPGTPNPFSKIVSFERVENKGKN